MCKAIKLNIREGNLVTKKYIYLLCVWVGFVREGLIDDNRCRVIMWVKLKHLVLVGVYKTFYVKYVYTKSRYDAVIRITHGLSASSEVEC